MSKIFKKALRISPVFLGAMLVLANSAIAAEAPAVETAQNQLITVTHLSTSFQQPTNPCTQESNTLAQITPVFEQLDVNSMRVPTNSVLTAEMARTQLIPAIIQPINISLLASIYRPTQESKSNTLTQLPNLSQQSGDCLSLSPPSYSLKASDLRLDTPSPVPEKSQYYLPTSKQEISETVTQQPNQPENTPPDKSQYNLFNPTPRELMRDFNSGRPSKTDSPYTVDAGHYQIEVDLVTYTRDTNNQDDIDVKGFQTFIPNIRVGLLNNVELQISPQTYNNVRTEFRDGTTEKNSGFGDTTVGVRVNFWGNDGGTTAFGMVSFIKLPTNQDNLGNNSIEGGVTFPLAIELSEKWNVGLQTQFNFNKNEADLGYNVGFVNSVVFGYQATDRLGTYFELFTDITTESGSELVATFDTGVTYLLTENLQLDAGVNIGITQAADDFNPFVGFAVRF